MWVIYDGNPYQLRGYYYRAYFIQEDDAQRFLKQLQAEEPEHEWVIAYHDKCRAIYV
jgi:hypothetical protein